MNMKCSKDNCTSNHGFVCYHVTPTETLWWCSRQCRAHWRRQNNVVQPEDERFLVHG